MEIDSDKNQIFLDTDNSFYFPGDTIKGNIYLIINQPILVSSLTLKIKGKEETCWDDSPTQNTPNHGLIIFYNNQYRLKKWEENEKEIKGNFIFPYSFLLKDFLPGTYNHMDYEKENSKKIKSAIIQYKLISEIFDYENNRILKYSFPLILRERLKAGYVPQAILESNFTSFFCFPSGPFHIKCFFEQCAFVTGQEGKFCCEIDNSQNSKSIRSIHCELKNKISLRSDEGNIKEIETIVHHFDIDGVAGCQKAEGNQRREKNIKFSKYFGEENKEAEIDIQESVNGQMISSKYVMEMTVNAFNFLSCKKIPKIMFPITIYKKIKEAKKIVINKILDPIIEDLALIIFSEANAVKQKNKYKSQNSEKMNKSVDLEKNEQKPLLNLDN